jgi:hypothetical protein
VSKPTAYRLCDRGEITHVRVSNAFGVRPEDLVVFLRGGRQP